MGYFIALLTTISLCILLLVKTLKVNSNIKKRFLKFNLNILAGYIGIFKNRLILKTIVYILLVFSAATLIYTSLTTAIYTYLSKNANNAYILKFLTIVVTAIIIYYIIGYVLSLFLKINTFIRATDDTDFQIDLLASFFVISIFLFILIIFPNEFKKIYGLSLFCLGITYLLTLRSLLRLMINPINIKNKNQDSVSFKRILTAALIILFMIIINLFLCVCTAYNVNINAYTNVNGYFSLFYYTIISFSTIGYGYIAPVSTLARAIAIVIALTSIISLTVFIGSILSYKDKFN